MKEDAYVSKKNEGFVFGNFHGHVRRSVNELQTYESILLQPVRPRSPPTDNSGVNDLPPMTLKEEDWEIEGGSIKFGNNEIKDEVVFLRADVMEELYMQQDAE